MAALGIVGWHGIQLHRTNQLKVYARRYLGGFGIALIIYALLPGYHLHLHHVILGVLLLPLTRFAAKPSVILQALAWGLIIQGYTAWGWDPYVEPTPVRFTLPILEAPVLDTIQATKANITWSAADAVQGYSLVLNGVEQYRGPATSFVIENLIPNMTYYPSVAVIGSGGQNGIASPTSNFTTLEA